MFSVVAGGVSAQDPTAQIQTQGDLATRPGPQVEINTAATASVTDAELGDIGIVKRRPRPKMFTFSTNQSLNFTTNAFESRDDEQSAFFWNGRFDASFVPYATRDFTPRLTFEQNFFRYDHFSRLDFDSQTLRLDLRYNLTRDESWFVNGAYGVTRLESPHSSIGEFYKFGLLDLNITHVVAIGSLPIYLATTGGVYWRHGDPSDLDRVSLYGSAVALYNVRENVQLSAFAKPELRFYTDDPADDSRVDFNVTIGATASWTPIEYVTLAASVAYIGNFSSESVRGYDVFTPAVVLAARIAF